MANSNSLTCVLFSDLFPWEKKPFELIASGIGGQHSIEVIDLPHRMRLETDSPSVWLVSKNWKTAIRYLSLTGKKQRIICSVMGLGLEPAALFTMIWRKFWPGRSSHVELVTHSPINFRFYTEIEKLESDRLSYLPLPFCQSMTKSIGSGQTLGVFGPFIPESNLHYFLGVAHYVHNRNPNAKFRIMGAGPLYGHAIEMTKQLSLDTATVVTETVDPEDLKYIDILVYAPVRNDHFIPLFLGAAHSIPVLSSEIPGIASFIKDSRNGFIVPTNEVKPMGELAIRLMENNNLRKFMGMELERTLCSRFSIDKLSQHYEGLFFKNKTQAAFSFDEAA